MIHRILTAAALALTLGAAANAATPPSFRVEPASVSETALLVPVRTDKLSTASSYSKVSIRTIDGTAKAGVDYTPINTTITFSNSALWWSTAVAIIARPGYQGNRSFTVHITAVRNAIIAQADATITILESDPPPPVLSWTKCADEGGTCTISGTAQVRYGAGATWLVRTVTGSIACDNATWTDPLFGTAKECDTTGAQPMPAPTPLPAPPPAPPTGAWVLAPLVNDGYARCKTVGGCHSMGTGYSFIIAQQGEVRQQAWNGCDAQTPVCRIIAAFWPVNHDPRKTGVWSDWTLGVEGWQDEWEGVAPAP